LHHRYSLDSDGYGEIHTGYTTLDTVPASMTMSVYCRCGKIVVLDRGEMMLKLKLDKELECMECRNLRIYNEIDEMDKHYLGISEEDVFSERFDPLFKVLIITLIFFIVLLYSDSLRGLLLYRLFAP